MRIGFAAVLAAALCVASPVFAEMPPPPSQTQKLNLSDVQKNIAPLASAFGVSKAASTDQNNSNNQNSSDDHKTLGDAADKALDMVQAVTAKVADTLSKIAPKVWEIMVRQQYAKAIAGPIVPLAVLIGAIFFAWIGHKIWREPTKSGDGEYGLRVFLVKVAPMLIVVVCIVWLGVELSYSVLYIVNPEYYAIQDLLQSIMNGGQTG